ncbi:hypothetical protein N7522_006531 [Penicillium canescens]|uniref:Uncharacterized protein n=1 Tax=Penicillium canescens TaxID=5083 RepID=A0AAD6I861_PENCN|nr:uncharacterized protein N7446_010417 [Penicillium canescens]KAJ6001304.1 hypothetical protein N7522_006531 [Penicillium canescens]KAJ6035657.1 hypothetical protein N7460_009832 [Penicillium canescens]KAJ6037779.1 hypothetical protein N7444_010484 [Penicillium canescens]KAJ6054405.1 hypothetical protein N7446_010417 [Penicillium canescens]
MHFSKAVFMGSAGLLAFTQVCPAAITEVLIGVLGGVVAGGVSGGVGAAESSKRDIEQVHARDFLAPYLNNNVKKIRSLPPGVSQESLDQCTQQINDQGTPVNVYSISDTAARADNVPAACMDLATVILSDPAQAGGPVPTPMGSSSLQYNGLSSKDKTDLQNALSRTGSRT